MAPIQLYSLATPNGQKIGVALEELGLPYEAHTINITKGDQSTPEYKKINPNGKIPAIVDPDGPDGKPLTLFESGAILLYLSEKAGGKLMPSDPAARWEAISWIMWQMGGLGPMAGQYNHFAVFAKEKIPYAIERYGTEVQRLLGVLEERLEGKQYIMGDDYTMADIVSFTWVNSMLKRLGPKEEGGEDPLGFASRTNVKAWVERCTSRPAAQRGMAVTPFPPRE